MSDESYLDLRVQRTRKAIRHAFLELLEEKEMNKISIYEIAKKAEINRVTFYSHYKDINDLTNSVINTLLSSIELILTQPNDNKNETKKENTPLLSLLEYIEKNAKIYKALLVLKHVPFFTPKLMELINQLIRSSTNKLAIEKADILSNIDTPTDIASWYITSAIVGTISIWLANDIPYSPQYLAEQIINFNLFYATTSFHTR